MCRDSAGVISHAEMAFFPALDPTEGEAHAVWLDI